MNKIKVKLYESPDGVHIPNKMYLPWYTTPSYAFAYYKKKLGISNIKGKHDQIVFGKTVEGFPIFKEREECEYAGRIWVGKKMLSFWEYPEPAKFKRIITDLEVELDIGIWNNNYNVEIVVDDAGELDTISKMDGENYYGAWLNVNNEVGMKADIIPIERYAGSAQRSKDEITKDHTVSPLLKASKSVPIGYGSNNPKADSKRKWRMAVPMGDAKQEVGGETLNESPDAVITAPGGTFVPWYESTNYAFGYLKDKFVIAPGKNAMHRDIPGASRRDFKFPGRIWPDLRVMSFWVYPNKEDFKKLVDDLNKTLDINIWKETGWKVEIVKNKKTGKVEDGQFDFKDGMVQGAWIQMSQKKGALVSVKNYRGSEDRHEDEKNKEHTVSPLLKTSQRVTPGFGSNNPKSETRFREKMYAPFESYYPRLNESPDHIWTKGRAWHAKNEKTFPFVIELNANKEIENVLLGQERLGHMKSGTGGAIITPQEHGPDKAIAIENRAYPGRVFFTPKVITFWVYPSKDELKKICEILSTKLADVLATPIKKRIEDLKTFVAELKIKNKKRYEDEIEFEKKTGSPVDYSYAKSGDELIKDYELITIPNLERELTKLPAQTNILDPRSKWQIEIFTNYEDYGAKKYFGEDDELETSAKELININDYLKSNKSSDNPSEKEYLEHIKTPLEKKTPVAKGFGSKHPKAEKKFKERMQAPFESYYPRLDESPDLIYINNADFTFSDKKAVAFSVTLKRSDNSIEDVMVGPPGLSHARAGVQFYPRGDGTFYQAYHGRVFLIPKVVTFWRYPTQSEMITIIHILEDKLDEKIFGNNWQLEIYSFDEVTQNLDSAFVNIDEYLKNDNESENVSDEEYEQHLKSPLLKKQRNVIYGFGSKHPDAKKLAQKKRDQPFESFYPRLNESPDFIDLDVEGEFHGEFLDYDDPDAHAFGIYEGKMYIGGAQSNHGEIHPTLPNRKSFDFPGRIWFESKVISFWQYPANRDELFKIIKMIEHSSHHFDILGTPGWRIEVLVDPKTDMPVTGVRFETFDFRNGKLKLIPLWTYKGSNEHAPVEHVKSPLLKKRRVAAGFGSKHPEAESKFKAKMQAPFESYYPRLNESPDELLKPNGDYMSWFRSQSYSFGFFKNIFYRGSEGGTHGDIEVPTPEGWIPRKTFEYPGRVWPDIKMISFWTYPDKDHFKDVIIGLKKYGIDILAPGWNVEILKDKENKLADVSFELADDKRGAWKGYFGGTTPYNVDFVHPSKYAGSSQMSDVEQNVQHQVSPLLRKHVDVTPGFGSKHPQSASRFKTKIQAPFESYYPMLNENPDEVHYNPFYSKNYYETIAFNRGHSYPFGYNKEGVMQIGSLRSDHARSGIDRYSGYPGRIWMGDSIKVITFWIYPERKNIKKVINDIEDVLTQKTDSNVEIWDDPDFKIEILRELEPTEFTDDKYLLPVDNHMGKVKDPFGDWRERSKIWDVIPLQQFAGSEQPSEEDLKQEHTVSPILKSKAVATGFGSKHPKAESKFKTKMQVPFESYYPRLNESPDAVILDKRRPKASKLPWQSDYAHAFGISSGRMYVSWGGGIHSDMHRALDREDYEYPGRIWTDAKLISFWQYPENQDTLRGIVKMIEDELNIKIWDDSGYRIEVLRDPTHKIITGEKLVRAQFDFPEDIKFPMAGKASVEIIPLKEYTKSEPHTQVDHQLSPLLKTSKDVPSGFGSKHPESSVKFQTKMQAPFESVK